VRIVVLGDLNLGDLRMQFGETDAIWGFLNDADVVLANLEAPLAASGTRADKPSTHRADPSTVHELKRLGVDAVALANNHSMDYGTDGLVETLRALDTVGISHAGAGLNREEAAAPARLVTGGLNIAFLSFACTVPAGAAATEERPGIAPIRVTTHYVVDGAVVLEQPGSAPYVATELLEADVETAVSKVHYAAANADFVVVYLHWGVVPLWMPSIQGALADYQRPLGHRLVAAGADLVVGTHSHVPQGVEVFAGKLIAYGLGDFVSHPSASASWDLSRPGPSYAASPIQRRSWRPRSGALLSMTAEAHAIRRAEFVPYTLDDVVEPHRALGSDAQAILRLMREASPYEGDLAVDGDVGRIAVA